jgi:hypothetical protein
MVNNVSNWTLEGAGQLLIIAYRFYLLPDFTGDNVLKQCAGQVTQKLVLGQIHLLSQKKKKDLRLLKNTDLILHTFLAKKKKK